MLIRARENIRSKANEKVRFICICYEYDTSRQLRFKKQKNSGERNDSLTSPGVIGVAERLRYISHYMVIALVIEAVCAIVDLTVDRRQVRNEFGITVQIWKTERGHAAQSASKLRSESSKSITS